MLRIQTRESAVDKLKIPLTFFIAATVTRLPFASRLLYNMDSVQFALGLDDYDVSLHQPHPPGYYLYVQLGKLARYFLHDPNRAFIAVSILTGALAVSLIYVLAREMFDEDAAMAAGLAALTSPLLWFHGEVALSYAPEALMSALVALLCWRTVNGRPGFWLYASVAIGIAGGIRQNTMVFLAPLWLYAMWSAGARKAAAGAFVAGATVLTWFVPMLADTGGYERYRAALSAHWLDANWHGIGLRWSLYNAGYMGRFIAGALAFAAVPAAVQLFRTRGGRKPFGFDGPRPAFLAAWIMPALLFHLVIFTHPAVPGHTLIYAAGLFVIAGRLLALFARGTAVNLMHGADAKKFVFGAVAAANAFFFVFVNTPLSAKRIREHDLLLSSSINAVRENFSPKDTEVLASELFDMGYRHAMYYLPEYRVHDNVSLTTKDGPRIFWGRGRKTGRSRYITFLPAAARFVDFEYYDPDDAERVPAAARLISLPEGKLMTWYDSASDLLLVPRYSEHLDPSLKAEKLSARPAVYPGDGSHARQTP